MINIINERYHYQWKYTSFSSVVTPFENRFKIIYLLIKAIHMYGYL